QRQLARRSLLRARPPTDLATRHQVPQAPLRLVVVRWDRRVRHKDEQFLEVPLDASAELLLDRQAILQKRRTKSPQPLLEDALHPLALPLVRTGEGVRLLIQVVNRSGPARQSPISW